MQHDPSARRRVNMRQLILFVMLILTCSTQAIAAQVCNATSIVASTPTAAFVDNLDGTITHSKTGLMWKQCSEGLSGANCVATSTTSFLWQGALQQAAANNTLLFAGHSDWRLPNLKELHSIVEDQCNSPAINATVFPATISALYWSSSQSAITSPANAWFVNFLNGRDLALSKNTPMLVRLVRGGQ